MSCTAEESSLNDQLNAANVQIASLVTNANNYQKCSNPRAFEKRIIAATVAQKAQDAYQAQTQAAELRQKMIEAEHELVQRSRGEYVANTLSTAANKIYDANASKIAGLNADIMTSKRLGTIHSQNLIHTRNTCDSLKITIVFVCFAILVAFCAVVNVLSYGVAQYGVAAIILALVVVLIVRALRNNNHYHMLYQERVFPDIAKSEDSSNQCKDLDEGEEEDTSLLDDLKWWQKKQKEKRGQFQCPSTTDAEGGASV